MQLSMSDPSDADGMTGRSTGAPGRCADVCDRSRPLCSRAREAEGNLTQEDCKHAAPLAHLPASIMASINPTARNGPCHVYDVAAPRP